MHKPSDSLPGAAATASGLSASDEFTLPALDPARPPLDLDDIAQPDPDLDDAPLADPDLDDVALPDPGLDDAPLADPDLDDVALPDPDLADVTLPDPDLADVTLPELRWDPRLRQIEAILFIAAEPVLFDDLSRALDCASAELRALLPALRAYFDGRGVRLLEHAEHLQLVSAPELTPVLERFLGTSQPARLSGAALEVLAIVAYRQPITRAQIEAIRGVDSSGVVRSLLARELIGEVGRAETLGRPILYATTRLFLQIFGIQHLDELPELELPVIPDETA